MKRNLDSVSQKGKKQRGVAVIFTLGILGLLTVMALGFASTALLNNSLSKNVLNISYARGLAKNLALTQAMYIISQKEIDSNGGFVDFRNVYTWGTDENSANHKDFLWKLDHNDAGVQIYKYEPDKTSDNPANNVRWQYVKDTSSPTPKIIGRYAYVVIPNRGRIDPSENIGRWASDSGTPDISTESLSSISAENLKKAESRVVPPSAKWNAAYNSFRWMSFQELLKKGTDITDANVKKYLFQYKGVGPSLAMKSPEAYYEDGKLYSRFNLNQGEKWKDITPEDLCGDSKTLAEFPAKQEFIPWLNKMYSSSDDQIKNQALQIAANIIQYNLPHPTKMNDDMTAPAQKTISDQDGDWLTNAPKYAGIGRHPMLNEIGFAVTVKGEVETTNINPDPEGPPIYQYTPKYTISVDSGAELICPFFDPLSGVVGSTASKSWVKFAGGITIKLTRFQSQEEINKLTSMPSALDGITILGAPWSFKTNEDQPIKSDDGESVISTWNKVDHTLVFAQSDWLSSPAYTKASSFWKIGEEKTITLPSFTLPAPYTNVDKTAEVKNWMEINEIIYDLKNTVLRYNNKPGADEDEEPTPGFQRDFAMLPQENVVGSSLSPTPKIGDKKQVVFIAFETKDPLVNHKTSDWTARVGHISEYPSGGPADVARKINEAYQEKGSVFDSDGGTTDAAGSHKNKTISGDDPAFTTTSRMETAIIRHDQMRSFWELGCISRGEAWKTLNLKKKDNSSSPDFTYDKGDAVLFDQLKFSDNDYTSGKINLNTDVHQVLEKIFDKTLIGFKSGLDNPANDSDNDLLKAGTGAPDEVKIQTQTLNGDGAVAHATSDPCLACLLLSVTNDYKFQNRADLLYAPANLPDSSPAAQTALTALQEKLFAGTTDLEKIQIVSKIMPILRTAPVDTLRVVILAQSIRDVGGNIPVLVDWYGKGVESAMPPPSDDEKKKALFKAGYRRSITGDNLVSTESEGVWKEPVFNGDDSVGSKAIRNAYTKNAIGTYDLGRDKITGETRLVATLVRDPVKRKWKLVRLQYVE